MNKEIKYDLQERLIKYSVRIINLSRKLPKDFVGKHIGLQVLRSGTSVVANYGEAQSAESKADFIHKLKLSLKELRETNIWLKILFESELIKPNSKLEPLLKETDELLAILYKSIETSKTKE